MAKFICTVCGYVQTVTVAHTFGEWGSRTDGYGRECTHCHHVEYLTQYYVKGTMNNWSENDDYKFVIDAANMKASLTVKLAAGDKFKVADASWSKEFNGKTIIAAEGLFKGEGDIEVVASGTYTFVITDLGGEAKCNVTAVLGEDEPTADAPTTGGDEPTVEVIVPEMPTVIYGNVDVASAKAIVEEHIIGKKLLDKQILDRPSIDITK